MRIQLLILAFKGLYILRILLNYDKNCWALVFLFNNNAILKNKNSKICIQSDV
jgi:hypothetical protein